MGVLTNLKTYIRRHIRNAKSSGDPSEVKHEARTASLPTHRHSRHNSTQEDTSLVEDPERGRKRERDLSPEPDPEPEISVYHWRTRKNAPLPQLPRRHFQNGNMSGSGSTVSLLSQPRPGALITNNAPSGSRSTSNLTYVSNSSSFDHHGAGQRQTGHCGDIYGHALTARSISLTRLTISSPALTLISITPPSTTGTAKAAAAARAATKAKIKAEKHQRRRENYLAVSAAVSEHLASGKLLRDPRVERAVRVEKDRERRREDVERKEKSWLKYGGLDALALEVSGGVGGRRGVEQMGIPTVETLKRWRRNFTLVDVGQEVDGGTVDAAQSVTNEEALATKEGKARVKIDDTARRDGDVLTGEVEVGPKLLKKVRKKLRKRSMPQFDMVVLPGEKISRQ